MCSMLQSPNPCCTGWDDRLCGLRKEGWCTAQGQFDEEKEGPWWRPHKCCEQLMHQPLTSTSAAQMAWGRADAVWCLVLLERVIPSTCFWVWGEKVTPTGACFTAGSGPATALWIRLSDFSFKQSSTNLLHLMISLIMHAVLLTSLSHVLQCEVPNPFCSSFVCVHTHLSN